MVSGEECNAASTAVVGKPGDLLAYDFDGIQCSPDHLAYNNFILLRCHGKTIYEFDLRLIVPFNSYPVLYANCTLLYWK